MATKEEEKIQGMATAPAVTAQSPLTKPTDSKPVEYKPVDSTGSAGYAQQMQMSAADQAALKAAGEAYNNATTQEERDAAHARAEAIRNMYGYSGGKDGSQNTIPGSDPSSADFVGDLDKWKQQAQLQQENRINYATEQGIKDLQRAEEDAQEKFQTQRNQISRDEARAMDNQALYAERRGDKGGIGAAQYAAIQNAAMENRRAVNQAQTKLATDTARQIADLRAKGEFEKADAMLSITQEYLKELVSLKQWSLQYGLSVRQFNEQLKQWEAEFELSVSQVTGTYKGNPTWQASQAQQSALAESGWQILSAGIMPSSSQLSAMQLTSDQAKQYVNAVKLQQAAKSSGGGSSKSSGSKSSGSKSSSSSSGKSGGGTDWSSVEAWAAKYGDDKVEEYLKSSRVYKALGFKNMSDAVHEWRTYQNEKSVNNRSRDDIYQSLGQNAKNALSAIQRNNARTGVKGLTAGQQSSLEKKYKNGEINEQELNDILTLLGY